MRVRANSFNSCQISNLRVHSDLTGHGFELSCHGMIRPRSPCLVGVFQTTTTLLVLLYIELINMWC